MRLFRDALNEQDRAHLRRVLGGHQDPTFSETKRRMKVNQMSTDDLYVDDRAVAPFQALPQADRERLISEVVWRLTCQVEGSTTRAKPNGHKLDYGFRMMLMVKAGRVLYTITKPK